MSAAFLLVLVACREDRSLVERFEQGTWQPVPFQVASMGGQRAGATVTFVLRLEAGADRRLVLEGSVEINPQATFVDGRWTASDGSAERSGDVTSAVVDFFGGQGDRPSLGGQFTLSAGGVTAYRINLPATQLGVER